MAYVSTLPFIAGHRHMGFWSWQLRRLRQEEYFIPGVILPPARKVTPFKNDISKTKIKNQ